MNKFKYIFFYFTTPENTEECRITRWECEDGSMDDSPSNHLGRKISEILFELPYIPDKLRWEFVERDMDV